MGEVVEGVVREAGEVVIMAEKGGHQMEEGVGEEEVEEVA